jgi:hypothetical protein
MEALLCAALLLATLVAVALETPTPVIAVSAASNRPNFSNHPKTSSNRATLGDIDAGSIESRWDSGSFWDEEAPAYDLTQSPHSRGFLYLRCDGGSR